MRNPITDPLIRQWWRDYRRAVRGGYEGAFTAYVAQRWLATYDAGVEVMVRTDDPWYMAACGHQHPWGAACSVLAVNQ